MPGKVLLEKGEHPERTYGGLYIPETAWGYDPNDATVMDSASELVKPGSRVLYYGWAVAVQLTRRLLLLSERDLVADVTGIKSLEDIKPLNGWVLVHVEPLSDRVNGLVVPDEMHRTRYGTVLTGEHKGKRTCFPTPVGLYFRGDIEGVRFPGYAVFVKSGAISLVWDESDG